MALRDRPFVRRLVETAEEWTGYTVAPRAEVQRLTTLAEEFQEFASDAEELAYHAMDYFGGRPTQLRPERRRRLAQRSRIALIQDPLAGAEAQLLADFAFGKGVSVPTARDPKVQDVIDEAWSDPINMEILTGYPAQRKLSNELVTAGEIFVTLFVNGGRIRVGRLDPDLVVNVVPDPENRLIPLWYVSRDRQYAWDFAMDSPKFQDVIAGGQLRVKYWPHWRFAEDAKRERDRWGTGADEQPLEEPPADKLAPGVVYHIAINQTGEDLRGNPPWARSLRFMSAMNVLTESHVAMAQAAASFVARRQVTSSPRQLAKAAASVVSAAGELGASALRPSAGWGVGGNAEPNTQPFVAPGTPGPFPPGSWWTENQASKLEALSLNSGAAQMAQTAQIVRAPVAASSGFGQHYLGDATNANLATASTLELPATMRIGGWQENFETTLRWFTDRAIEAAVKAGRLGGAEGFDGDKPLAEMRLQEAEDRAAMERRTEKDLSYEFTMPFPGRRQLADVTTAVQVVCASMDPNGVNVPLRKVMLRFLFEQIGIDDVSRAVEECIPEKGLPGGIGPQQAGSGFGPAAGAGGAGGAGGAAPGGEPPEGQQPYGAKSGTAAGGGSAGEDGSLEAEWVPQEARASAEQLQGATAAMFARMVADPAVVALAAAANGGEAA